jgi:hypothetical protein
LKDLGSVINSLIGGGKSEKAKKKKAAAVASEPAVTPAPAESSLPAATGDVSPQPTASP